MASEATISEPATSEPEGRAALQHRSWRRPGGLSSGLRALAARLEQFLGQAGFERAPWLTIAFAAGIGLWFGLANSWQWLAMVCVCLATAIAAFGLLAREGGFPYLRQALGLVALTLAAGCLTVWTKSELVGAKAISQPVAASITGRVIARQEQPVMICRAVDLPRLPTGD